MQTIKIEDFTFLVYCCYEIAQNALLCPLVEQILRLRHRHDDSATYEQTGDEASGWMEGKASNMGKMKVFFPLTLFFWCEPQIIKEKAR